MNHVYALLVLLAFIGFIALNIWLNMIPLLIVLTIGAAACFYMAIFVVVEAIREGNF